jgi:hypothetical protein
LCCARGALIDVLAKIELQKHGIFVPWAREVPTLDDRAPSGVFERLSDAEWRDPVSGEVGAACAALDGTIAGSNGGVHGLGCSLRLHAVQAGLAEDIFLPDACALFPLDLVDSVLVPSSRIPEEALADASPTARTLWDDARPRVALRFGAEVARALDDAAKDLRDHHLKRALHLKTFK